MRKDPEDSKFLDLNFINLNDLQQKDLQQTSSHVLLFNTDVSPFGLFQSIYKIKTWIKLQGENKVT